MDDQLRRRALCRVYRCQQSKAIDERVRVTQCRPKSVHDDRGQFTCDALMREMVGNMAHGSIIQQPANS